jgi:hypothetical protein
MEVVIHLFEISKNFLSSTREEHLCFLIFRYFTSILDGQPGGRAAGEIKTKANSAKPSLAGTGAELGIMVQTESESENLGSGYKKQNCNAKIMD